MTGGGRRQYLSYKLIIPELYYDWLRSLNGKMLIIRLYGREGQGGMKDICCISLFNAVIISLFKLSFIPVFGKKIVYYRVTISFKRNSILAESPSTLYHDCRRPLN